MTNRESGVPLPLPHSGIDRWCFSLMSATSWYTTLTGGHPVLNLSLQYHRLRTFFSLYKVGRLRNLFMAIQGWLTQNLVCISKSNSSITIGASYCHSCTVFLRAIAISLQHLRWSSTGRSEHGGLIQGLFRRTTPERILYLVFPLTLPYNLAWIELEAFFYELFIWAHTL